MNSLGAGRGAQTVGLHVLQWSLRPQECWVKRGVGVRAPGRPVFHGGTRPPCPLHPTLSSKSQLRRHPRPAGAHTLPLCTPGPRHVWTSGSQTEPSGWSGGQAASPRPVGHPRGSGAITVFPGARAPPVCPPPGCRRPGEVTVRQKRRFSMRNSSRAGNSLDSKWF